MTWTLPLSILTVVYKKMSEKNHKIKQITATNINDKTDVIYCLTTEGEIIAKKVRVHELAYDRMTKIIHVNQE